MATLAALPHSHAYSVFVCSGVGVRSVCEEVSHHRLQSRVSAGSMPTARTDGPIRTSGLCLPGTVIDHLLERSCEIEPARCECMDGVSQLCVGLEFQLLFVEDDDPPWLVDKAACRFCAAHSHRWLPSRRPLPREDASAGPAWSRRCVCVLAG